MFAGEGSSVLQLTRGCLPNRLMRLHTCTFVRVCILPPWAKLPLYELIHINGAYGMYVESKKISNDQVQRQSDPISCPQNEKGNN